MTKEVFNKLSFEEAVSQLQDEGTGTITDIEILKEFIKEIKRQLLRLKSY